MQTAQAQELSSVLCGLFRLRTAATSSDSHEFHARRRPSSAGRAGSLQVIRSRLSSAFGLRSEARAHTMQPCCPLCSS
jgi:hypothetical protein